MENLITELIPQQIENISLWTYFLIYLGGILTSFSPCVLGMIPVLVAYIGGYGQPSKLRGFSYSVAFSTGLALTFAVLGVIASAIGSIFGQIGRGWFYGMAGVSFLMGLQLLGIINLRFPSLPVVPPKVHGILGAFLTGFFFGLVATACSTPVLAVVLTYVATKGQLWYGASLLFTYGLGQGMLLIVVGTFTGALKQLAKMRQWSHYLTTASGLILMGVGLYYLSIAVR
ncbi:cytochrome c biogenesis protein CcdA [Calderihabitans maritimus]|uniref:Cytochrome c biogenesis protein transmembrane region n=1 Tax=Calderihabitans maritimus TaxID=1246530 RepID=A0A1Z5HWD8_9FIRM|nr:cytochrome c biogenesis protein CcdA [Calderihabitans maritimus]GAW93728.1 cytochrome c biogenesis protein transmembrane region [Calderihabitans maritimus]